MALLYAPNQVVLVSCRGRVPVVGRTLERDYVIATMRHMPLSDHPALYAVAIPLTQQEALAAIDDEGAFVVNFIADDMANTALVLSDHTMTFDDAFQKAGITKTEAAQLPLPRVKEAVGWAECELNQRIQTGDHVLLIGRVIHADLPQPAAKRLLHLQGDQFTTTL